MNRAILVYHTAVLDPNFVFVMVMYGVTSAIVGFLAHMLISKIRKEFNAKAEARQVRAAVDAFNNSVRSDTFPGEAWGTILSKDIIDNANFGVQITDDKR